MCKFCDLKNFTTSLGGWDSENDKYDFESTISYGNLSALDMGYDSKNKKFMLIAFGDGRTVVDIEFCPFCGRHLIKRSE